MLKKLELVGFKSFADKTVFSFGDGVTAIVGPNGSGKSNVVDAVRWIMGEQSAKSLRGGEMADVIFNGSSTRRSLGLAEVTMTFDNRKRQLSLDHDEVEITRRVYRTGEGEYLVNGQTSRLKDIKDLFLGSGAGTDALCIIAQGKVDVLLQASTKDRRSIFEEAAGISRFKVRKIETLRKLEKVDQNLSRVKDIVDEVEKQLRSVKLQAAKAQRYQEHSTRLKELRIAVGLVEYRGIRDHLAAQTQVLDSLKADLDLHAARAGACEAEAERLEILVADLEDALREQEGKLNHVLQEIQVQQSTLNHETSLSEDLENELRQTRQRLSELSERVRTLADAQSIAAHELEDAERQALGKRESVLSLETQLRETETALAQAQQQSAADKAQHLEQMRRAAHLRNEAVAGKAHMDNLRREHDRLHSRTRLVTENLASIDLELQELISAEDRLQQKLAAARAELAERRDERERLRQEGDRTAQTIGELREKRSGVASRIEVLEGLIRSHEGLGSGVREAIALLEQPNPGPWSTVLGMVADFLTVKREYAPLIDLALGDWAQRFLVRDMRTLADALAERQQPFSGRVSFMPVQPPDDADASDPLAELRTNRIAQSTMLTRLGANGWQANAEELPGVVAPAEQVVSCDHPELGDLPSQLFGRTIIVKNLAAARTIARRVPSLRLVTMQGELLEPDGTVTIGSHHAESGILARKSELHDLIDERDMLDVRIAAADRELADLKDRLERSGTLIRDREEELGVLAEQTADLRSRVDRHRDRRQGLHQEAELSRDEMQKLDDMIADLDASYRRAEQQAEEAETQVQLLVERLQRTDESIRQHERQRAERQTACTQAQVALATMEERLGALRSRHGQLTRDWQQRRQEQQQGEQSLHAGEARLLESQMTMLQASAVLAQAYLDKESAQRRVHDDMSQRESKRHERARLSQQAQTARTEWRQRQEQFHHLELEANNLRHQAATLLTRLRDDYQIELESLVREAAPDETPLDLPAAQAEIEDLRKKLSRLGSVNLESLQELQELESRAGDMQAQYDDLVSAKRSLEEVIGKINHDSKKLFMDAFAAIRTHFQELFRKLFGGGMADIILEDEADVLESGIEVIARPPGKELRSISLMSGGEKTMTAVALLLAVFRSKPSPFCILDEVDAALDEANIGRFTSVVREFLDQSQFIIVTHSKKTMSAADVLYGITMQESGISKQVTIRFEDWVDEAAEQPA
jgi:chromosome segregation protein